LFYSLRNISSDIYVLNNNNSVLNKIECNKRYNKFDVFVQKLKRVLVQPFINTTVVLLEFKKTGFESELFKFSVHRDFYRLKV
jgi:hypothetical protein